MLHRLIVAATNSSYQISHPHIQHDMIQQRSLCYAYLFNFDVLVSATTIEPTWSLDVTKELTTNSVLRWSTLIVSFTIFQSGSVDYFIQDALSHRILDWIPRSYCYRFSPGR